MVSPSYLHFQGDFILMMSAMWEAVARNVQMVLLCRLIQHQEHENKIASLVLKVTIEGSM